MSKKIPAVDLISPFQWRYGNLEIKKIWSENRKRELWRKIWLEHLKALSSLLRLKIKPDPSVVDKLDLSESFKLEEKVKHDLFAELAVFSSQLPPEFRRLVHFGLTSADIEENCDSVRLKTSLKVLLPKFAKLLEVLAVWAKKTKTLPALGYTHLMPAEPITLGQRFAYYLQDLLFDFQALNLLQTCVKGKGLRGTVGNASCLIFALGEKTWRDLEKRLLNAFDLEAFDLSTQIPSRKVETHLIMSIASASSSMHKIAFDLRLLSSKGELRESFDYSAQVGSSAMPFKVNPVKCEQVCSLSRFIMVLSQLQLHNTSLNLLERTLDDSANRRILIPEIFMAFDHCLTTLSNVISNLKICSDRIAQNLKDHSLFTLEALKALLMLEGYSHIEAYNKSRQVWLESVKKGKSIQQIIMETKLLSPVHYQKFMTISKRPNLYTGIAAKSVDRLLLKAKRTLKKFYESWKK